MDITKPIMRGITLELGEKMLPKWFPFEYEFLPDFCYTCGIIGHSDRSCSTKLVRGEKQQFGKWLKADIPQKSFDSGYQRWSDGKGSKSGSGSGGRQFQSWRKPDVEVENKRISGQVHQGDVTGEQEAASSLKLHAPTVTTEKANKQLVLLESESIEKEHEVSAGFLLPETVPAQHGYPEKPAMHGLLDGTSIGVEGVAVLAEVGLLGGGVEVQVSKSMRRTFKRQKEVRLQKTGRGKAGVLEVVGVKGGEKRSVEGVEVLEGSKAKRGRVEEVAASVREESVFSLCAGLRSQPCEEQ
jgi:hypothetical protein